MIMSKNSELENNSQKKILKFPFFVLAIGLGVFSTVAVSETKDMITLFYAGEDGISGEILDYDGKVFRIASTMGKLTIPAEDLSCIGTACPDEFRLQPTLPRVVLFTPDRKNNIEGNLIEVTNTDYVLATDLGNLQIPVNSVVCEGEGCPEEAGQLPATGMVSP